MGYTQLPIQVVPWVNRMGRRAEEASTYIAVFKNEWECIATPTACVTCMYKDRFIFLIV